MTQHLFVINLGNKEMIIEYLYLYKHNPNINWWKGQWEFTRYLDTYTSKACKIWDVKAEANKLYLELDVSRFPLLDDIKDKDPNNYILSWADTTDPDSHQQVIMIVSWLSKWLSHYLYLFSFIFLSGLTTTRKKCRKVSHDKCHT